MLKKSFALRREFLFPRRKRNQTFAKTYGFGIPFRGSFPVTRQLRGALRYAVFLSRIDFPRARLPAAPVPMEAVAGTSFAQARASPERGGAPVRRLGRRGSTPKARTWRRDLSVTASPCHLPFQERLRGMNLSVTASPCHLPFQGRQGLSPFFQPKPRGRHSSL